MIGELDVLCSIPMVQLTPLQRQRLAEHRRSGAVAARRRGGGRKREKRSSRRLLLVLLIAKVGYVAVLCNDKFQQSVVFTVSLFDMWSMSLVCRSSRFLSWL